jgi:hypothetical protein
MIKLCLIYYDQNDKIFSNRKFLNEKSGPLYVIDKNYLSDIEAMEQG